MSRQGSAPSHGSRASNTKYKTVGHGGVDDALFGGSKTGGARNSTMSKDDLNTLLTKKPANVETDSIVITTGDLQRLRTLATVVDKSALEQQKHQEAAAKMALQAKARERKEKMVAMEVKRKANLVKSDLEAEDETKSANLLENSERARDEQLDDVKHMNQMMLYAKCVTIRDAQLLEKQMIQKEKADLEKSFDALMEQATSPTTTPPPSPATPSRLQPPPRNLSAPLRTIQERARCVETTRGKARVPAGRSCLRRRRARASAARPSSSIMAGSKAAPWRRDP